MISKKVCLLGSICVGKTSLATRFVYSCFSDKYLSTIGVKLHKKSLDLEGTKINLIVWDIQGEDRYDKILVSFLKGLSGYILVVDVTQPKSAEVALQIRDRVQENFGNVPYVLAYNKIDLPEDASTFEISQALESSACGIVRTSALTGAGVEEAFHSISKNIMPLKKTG